MKNWTKLKAIILDLDDTLYAERDFVISGFGAVAAWSKQALDLQPSQSREELLTIFNSGERGDIFNRWLDMHELPLEPWLEQAVGVYRQHVPSIQPFSDTVYTLERFQQRFRLGLVTEGSYQAQQNKLEALGLRDYFEAVVILGFEERERWKPEPYPFELLLRKMRLRGDQTIYAGDNPAKDFKGARQLGMGAVRIRRPEGFHYTIEAQGPTYEPDLEVSSLEALDDLLLEKMMEDR